MSDYIKDAITAPAIPIQPTQCINFCNELSCLYPKTSCPCKLMLRTKISLYYCNAWSK